MNRGESIYASQPQCVNPYTNAYTFAEYRIYEYDSEGNRGTEPIYTTGNVSKIFTVPDDFEGTELSVEPVGKYQKRNVSFETYRMDEDGNHIAIPSGRWEVNGTEYKEDMAQINPSDTYVVKYYFDPNEYYVVNTEPAYFSQNSGEVEFPRVTPMDTDNNYKVQLRKYITVSLEGEVKYIESVEANQSIYADNKPFKVSRLKVGDEISIVTTEGYRLYCSAPFGSESFFSEPERLEEGKVRYYFKVPETNEEVRIRISKSEFTVSIASSVGNDASFDIKASGFQYSDLVYDLVYEKENVFSSSRKVVDDTIGAEESIAVSAKGGTLPEGCVLRLDIEKTDSNSNKTKQIEYISSLPGNQIVSIYENGDASNVSKVYKDVHIDISLVKAAQYKKGTVDKGTMELHYAEVIL